MVAIEKLIKRERFTDSPLNTFLFFVLAIISEYFLYLLK